MTKGFTRKLPAIFQIHITWYMVLHHRQFGRSTAYIQHGFRMRSRICRHTDKHQTDRQTDWQTYLGWSRIITKLLCPDMAASRGPDHIGNGWQSLICARNQIVFFQELTVSPTNSQKHKCHFLVKGNTVLREWLVFLVSHYLVHMLYWSFNMKDRIIFSSRKRMCLFYKTSD